MNYKTKTEQLIRSYETKVAWGEQEHEEALQEAVDAAFPDLADEVRAELYTRIADAWEGYRDGMVPRRLWIGSIISTYMSERAGAAFREVSVNG